MLVPRVEPGGCALASQSHHIAMFAVDPENDDVWVVVTPYSPDATQGFVQLHSALSRTVLALHPVCSL